ncbi:hypothetical protein MUU74_16265 [Chryseobacterium daecheongense]|uniref:hypothetical protein n=1 Tax=Chryseobacterium daecheongense TaxID=192389 RepID=UPI001FD63C12|nr:hypothetical protein [Chryseobacterium daecheongense]UOU98036.1 hypothetical protein MUU74_16265 [Chryseobacterium daecheongense]
MITTKLIIYEKKRRTYQPSSLTKLESESKNRTLSKINDYVLFPILIIFSIYFLTFAYADLNLNTSFNQRLNVLKPYIDSDQEELLISKWALMKNRNDFNKINKEMEDLAKKNKVILPENLIN